MRSICEARQTTSSLDMAWLVTYYKPTLLIIITLSQFNTISALEQQVVHGYDISTALTYSFAPYASMHVQPMQMQL